MTTDCIFCKIVTGEIPSETVYQDRELVAFRDINPITPVHLLIVPRKHIPSIVHLSTADMPIVGKMTAVANHLARIHEVIDSGYRLVINCGEQAGQTVPHIHMHLLGGRRLTWNY